MLPAFRERLKAVGKKPLPSHLNANSGTCHALTQKPKVLNLAQMRARQPSLRADRAATCTSTTATGAGRGCRAVGTSCETLPVPGSVGAGPSLLGPPLIQGCLLSLAQITEAGRTHELQPAKSPHGQMCVCARQLQIEHPVTHTHARLERQQQQCKQFPPLLFEKET